MNRFYVPFFFLNSLPIGSWTIITEMSIMALPIHSLALGISCRTIIPVSTAKTDSRLISIEATVGPAYFCPTISSVYALPLEKMPA